MKKDFVFFYHLIIKKVPDRWLVKFSNTKLGTLFIKFLKSQKKPVDIGNGLKMYFDYTNPRLSHIVYDDDIEEAASKQAFLDLIDDGDIVIDVGANTGYYTLNIASKLKEGKIISIEADPNTFKILEKNCNINKISNSEIHNVACSNHEGNIDFFKTDKHSGINSILDQPEKNNFNKIKIKSNTLDNIINSRFKKIDWIKIDVEGAELFVLEGAQETLNYTKHIIIEIHEHILEKNNQTSQQIINILKKNKFKIKLFPEYWKSSSPNQILKSDYIYGEK